ncbi:hypothetical protein [Bacteriovorax sp. Seq25_V]|uniref:hypothetical protein n=1 Tax=Bacteriovorax sp. Seq25_V TaxID=1201288 RepID=UPI000389FC9D|nr:hypothetical protein [Bacteriovorax sp. Seq25_V]EQC46610.1 hypothetical protein M900_2444 [Bacteriovorax sp. Seq25_V]
MEANNKAYHSVIRVSKADSAFLYFKLEANEGLCFYSTLPFERGDQTRDIKICCDISTKDETLRLLDFLSKNMKIEVLSEEEISY